MKTIITFYLFTLLSLTFGLAGCSPESADDTGPASAAASESPAGQRPPATDVDQQQRAEQSRELAMTFAKQLKKELQAAMADGGPEIAIEVCHQRAPKIAAALSEMSGWQVHRTSLKPRNRAPDAWEQQVLEDFDVRANDGEEIANIEYYAVVDTEDGPAFRYMKALGTEPLCLTCHGESISAPLLERLDALYPDDRARGYRAGEIRGAISITQPPG